MAAISVKEQERLAAVEKLKQDFFLPPLFENRYRIQKIIGEGSYGVVCSAIDSHTEEPVAVKRIMRVFDQVPEAIRILRELKFLRVLREHENIITTRDVLLPSNRESFNDVFVVFDLMPADLNRVFRSRIALSPEHIRWLIYQLLRGVAYLHRAKVFHRDLKPSNILINSECDLIICDFGLARAMLGPQEDPSAIFWTDYVATRWYRAPELIMCSSYGTYTPAIDIWSCGVIFAEMLNCGKPLFPGLNSINQLELITRRVGFPSREVIAAIQDPAIKAHLENTQPQPPVYFKDLFPNADATTMSFLENLLQLAPEKRPTAEQALRHPYFADLQHDTLPDPPAVNIQEFDFEARNPSKEEIREMFLEEILKYHPEKRHLFQRQPAALEYERNQAGRFRQHMMAMQNPGHTPGPMYQSLPPRRFQNFSDNVVHDDRLNMNGTRQPYGQNVQGGEDMHMQYVSMPSDVSASNGVIGPGNQSSAVMSGAPDMMSYADAPERVSETVDSMQDITGGPHARA